MMYNMYKYFIGLSLIKKKGRSVKEDITQLAKERKIGILYAGASFTAWGLLPIYWKLLKSVSPGEILANRIIWSFVFVSCLLIWNGNYKKIKENLVNKRNLALIALASIIISFNWFTYIWAVNSNFVVQASMGYYINPLVISLLSATVLKEKFNKGQTIAIALASIGVVIMTYQYGRVPWIALILAVTFAFYGLIKKVLKVDSIIGLALETVILTPFALGYVVYKMIMGTGTIIGVPPLTMIILAFAGVVTATPLVWFARGAQKVEFATIGFLQYIAPTLSLLLGIFLFKEEFNKFHLISFGFIWLALAVYTLSTFKFSFNKFRKPITQSK